MTTIAVEQKYVDALRWLGDAPDEAFRRYTVERIRAKIEELEAENAQYEQKYNVTYAEFNERISTDEAFVLKLRQIEPLWERDSIHWEFCIGGLKEWRGRLTNILKP